MYSHGNRELLFRTAGNVNRFKIGSDGTADVIGTSDGVLQLDTSDSRGAFIRFGQDGSFHHMVGCADGLVAGPDKEDLGLRAKDNMVFCTNGANEKLRITSDGKVGINEQSPQSLLDIHDSASANDTPEIRIESFRPIIRFADRSSSHADSEICGDDGIKFRVSAESDNDTALTERLRITSDGKVGINQSSPSDRLEINPVVNNEGLTIKSTGAIYPAITGNTNRTGADQFLLNIRGMWNDTTVANILLETGDDTTNKDNGVITFRTASAGSPAERFRIDSSGNVYVKSSSGNQQPKLRIESYGEYGEIKADGNGSIIIDADPDFNSNNSYIGFSVDGSVKSTIDSNGTLNIGATTPTFTSPTPSLNIELSLIHI